jgi:pimeloyl-ACP methyl ester carboxylesterase
MPDRPRSHSEWDTLNWLLKKPGSSGLLWGDSSFPLDDGLPVWVIADGFCSAGPSLRILGKEVSNLFYSYKPLIDLVDQKSCAFSYFQPSRMSGFSYGPRNTTKSLEEAVVLIAPYLARHPHQKVTYIGFSLGGLLLLVGLAAALSLSVITAEQVGGLIMVQPPLHIANAAAPLATVTAIANGDASAEGERIRSSRVNDVRSQAPIKDFVDRRSEVEALVSSSAGVVAGTVRTVAVVWEGDQFAPYEPTMTSRLQALDIDWQPIPNYQPMVDGAFAQHAEVARHDATKTYLTTLIAGLT